MVLSRVWYLVLAIAAGAGVSAALLTYGMFNRQYEADLEDSLRRDRREMEATLKLEARAQIDQIAAFAANDDIRAIHGAPADSNPMVEFAGGTLQGRPAAPEELTPFLVYLASPESDYMTGQMYMVDGGQVLV